MLRSGAADLHSMRDTAGFCRKTGTADLLNYTPVPGISIFGQIVISFKGRHHQQEIILQCVRWYVAYSLSYRDLEELMQERGYAVDHSTVQRWVVHYAPRIEKAFRKNKKRIGNRWRLDETYIKIKGEWKYLYRAVDKQGNTVDFLLTAKRDKKAARRFLNKAIGSNGKPSLINIDKSGANTAAIQQYNRDENKRVKIRQCKYLNNIVEQDHRFIKRRTRPMLGFKSFWSARATLAGIELWRMLKKGQNKSSLPAWEQFYALALIG
jgi:transposase-like protein